MRLRLGRLLFHPDDPVGFIHLHYTAFAQARLIGLVVAHDAGRALGGSVADELCKAEIQDIVPRYDQQVIIDMQAPQGELYVPDGPKTGLVGGSAVVNHRDVRTRRRPVPEMACELVVGNDDELIHGTGRGDIVHQPVKDSLVTYFQ